MLGAHRLSLASVALSIVALAGCGNSDSSNSVQATGGAAGTGHTGGVGGTGQPGTGGGNGQGGSVLSSGDPCAKLQFDANKTVAQTIGASTATDVITWQDANCKTRTAAMARDDRGYLRQVVYDVDGKPRSVTGTNVNGWNGMGFIINHGMSNCNGGTPGPTGYKATFVGAHHAIYEYRSNVGTSMPVTRQWLFATGRDHPLFAVTFDVSKCAPGVGADSRTPYGDMAWDGDDQFPRTIVDGVGWGDHYKFVTKDEPLALSSSWDYTEPNTIPYCFEWRKQPDAEMGLVQTQTYLQHDAGGYWLYKNWGKTSANQTKDTGQAGAMPIDWNWPYQLNQYELCYVNGAQSAACVTQPTNSHRIAWGMNYGAVGGADTTGMYPALGDAKKLNAFPGQSYSVFVVLGKHSTQTVFTEVKEIETVQKTTLTASVGTVVTDLPAGVARADTVKLDPVGWDPRYATWNLQAASNKVAFKMTVAAGTLTNPVVVVQGFTGTSVPAITVDGAAATADVHFFASLDSVNKLLWVTFRGAITGTHSFTIG